MAEFIPFRFEVSLYERNKKELLCRGYFSEVTGLEVTMEPRAIQEGGRNWGEIQRVGQTRFTPLVLKRGVTRLDDLWAWFDAVTRGQSYGYRLHGTIKVLGSEMDGNGQPKPVMVWALENVLPTRFKGPDLSSTASQVAIEEITLIHESLMLETATG
ncbi:phage tail protein [Cellvibrio japonicus]|uniref:Conserved hypothetical phage tail region protein subfamily n=1 Tax=Cellvibrio japonicus (strain Ueda107) TaxID=498211 RepID=B3PD93_CELJU|nr:phage tail protein [Cellvibrio japonicus]ACE83732.1 conserved hypothetical phage tail region protein subfamily [Cellvibrio japonicus Ueda107]QEI13352.1 phage tail protein [Cellvibrio japonicus]QEI16926.1 phage tail protein [Cellvibrio japonicus]QEI20504.1 phage tail protein [Cellvibrio japonicus]